MSIKGNIIKGWRSHKMEFLTHKPTVSNSLLFQNSKVPSIRNTLVFANRMLLMAVLLTLICPTLPAWADTWTRLAGQEGCIEWRADAKGESEGLVCASIADVWSEGMEVNVTVPSVSASPLYDPHGNEYIQLRSPGCGATAQQVGLPEMPFKGFFVEIPYGVVVSVDIQGKKSTLLGTGIKVYPLQSPQPDNGKAGNNSFQVDQSVYATNSFFPSDCVVLGEPGIIRGRRVVFVQVFPFQYNPATTELWAFSSLRFTLNFKGQADPSGQDRKRRLATDVSESLAKTLILNYEPIIPSRSKGEPELSTGSAADYLIIVADNLYEETLPLAIWKHKKGFITRVVTMSGVGSTATDVKNYIQNAYDNWTPAPSYVLLVGDSEDVPPDYYSGDLACSTDNSYACVDGADYYPDLTIGRLPVHTETECTNVVDKILYYDRTPDIGSWYDEFLAAGYFQDSDDDNGIADRWFMETSMTIYDFLVNEQGWSGHTALCTSYWPQHYSTWHFSSDSYPHRADINLIRWGTSPYPDPVPQWVVDLWTSASDSTQDVTDAINAGVGIVQHRDHGGETLWGHPPYGISHIDSLSNGVKTPVVFSTNCLTGSFQRGEGDCFCEAFLKKSPGGCVGIVGATRTSFSGYNDLLVHGTYTSFWPSYDTTHSDTTYPHSWRPAQALNYGKYYMLFYMGPGNYTEGEFYMFHWFGDPEMLLRTETPQSLVVTHPSEAIACQPTNITIDVDRGGLPLENALVCISHPTADDHWSGLTDAAGSITFSGITLTQQGDNYDIVVSDRGSVPCEGVIYAGLSDCGNISLDREVYSCDDTIRILVGDISLQGSGTHDITVTTSGGDFETVTLTEDPLHLGLFEEWIQTCTGSPGTEDGILQIAHGETITATYEDTDYCGTGNPETIQDTATADCQPPAISNVQVINIGSASATITFETDELTTGQIQYGLLCSGTDTTVEDLTFATAHSIDLTELLQGTPYYFVVVASDSAYNSATDSNGGSCYTFTTTDLPDDYLTEMFSASDNDLDNISITFIPDGTANYYTACAESISVLPTDPSGGTSLPLGDDDSELVSLSAMTVSLYGESYGDGEVWAGSNGYLTFGAGDTDYSESLADHFNLPRISALFDDLNPSAGGTVSYKQLGDRLTVTWENVPEFGTSNSNTFQIEMFFNGQIRISWLAIEATDGLAGLSGGLGIPANFTESDLSDYGPCCCLIVSPNQEFFSVGPEGGPFTPLCETYRLTNTCGETIDWTAEWGENWLDVTPTGGTLLLGEYVDVNVCIIEAIANNMSIGGYNDTVIFNNQTTECSLSRGVTLNISEVCELPTEPDNPDPCDGEINVPLDTNLTWNTGGSGDSFKVSGRECSASSLDLILAAIESVNSRVTVGQNSDIPMSDGSAASGRGSGGIAASIAFQSESESDSSPNVAIVAAASSNGITDPSFTDPQSKLLATGKFNSVSMFDAQLVTLTLSELQAFDAVIVWSNASFLDSATLGDNMADYVDSGGGVVLAVFATTSTTTTRYLLGRFLSDNYYCITPAQGDIRNVNATLGTIFNPSHPTVAGVNSFDGGSASFRPATTSLVFGTTLIAEWSDGQPLITARSIGGTNRVDLGMYPPSNTVYPTFWVTGTNGDLIMANALEFVSGGGSCDTTWDVYFGTEGPPTELVCSNLSEPGCDPGPLEPCMKYYWQVVAKNCCGQTAGEVWEFTTEELFPPQPNDPNPNDGAANVSVDTTLAWSSPDSPDATGSLTTTFAGGNGLNGNMFDLTAKETITITGWEGNIDASGGPATIEVYYVTDHTTFVGKETNPALWTLLGSATLTSTNPAGTPTVVEIGGLTIAGNETVGIYWTTTASGVDYTNGPLGVFENAELRFEDRGTGNGYPFGSIFSPRVWNGTICYEIGSGYDTTWDVYFGTENPPTTLVCADLTESICDPGLLQYCTTYFWQVVAKNCCGETPGEIWLFKTKSVDMIDLSFFVSHWLDTDCSDSASDESDWCFGTDLDQSTVVDFSDYARLAACWLGCPE